MKTSTKVLIGTGITVGVVAAATASTVFLAREKIHQTFQRKKVKDFVKRYLKNSPKILHMIDRVPDDKLGVLVSIVDRTEDMKKRVAIYGENLREATVEFRVAVQNLMQRS